MILLQKRFTLFQTQFVNIGGNSLVELIFEMHEQRRTAIMKNTAQIGNSNAFPIVFADILEHRVQALLSAQTDISVDYSVLCKARQNRRRRTQSVGSGGR